MLIIEFSIVVLTKFSLIIFVVEPFLFFFISIMGPSFSSKISLGLKGWLGNKTLVISVISNLRSNLFLLSSVFLMDSSWCVSWFKKLFLLIYGESMYDLDVCAFFIKLFLFLLFKFIFGIVFIIFILLIFILGWLVYIMFSYFGSLKWEIKTIEWFL